MEKLNNPLISILIPVYNREDLIERSVLSALNQTYRNLEVIICDNCSTDNTFAKVASLAENDARIKYYKNAINLGPVLNWGECLAKASGEYAMFLWSDDYINDTFIENTHSLFDVDIAFVLASYRIQNGPKCIYQSFFQMNSTFKTHKYLSSILVYQEYDFPVSPASALFRRKDLVDSFVIDIPNYKGLDFKRFGAGNDLMFFLSISIKYKFIRTSSKSIAYFSYHEGSISVSNKLEQYYELAKLHFIQKHSLSLIQELYSKHKLRNVLGKTPVLDENDFRESLKFQSSYIPRLLISRIFCWINVFRSSNF